MYLRELLAECTSLWIRDLDHIRQTRKEVELLSHEKHLQNPRCVLEGQCHQRGGSDSHKKPINVQHLEIQENEMAGTPTLDRRQCRPLKKMQNIEFPLQRK